MRKFLMFQISFMLTLVSIGQIKSIDLGDIKKIAETASYDDLLKRYLTNDTTLSLDDYRIIYYGHAFKESYNPHARHDSILTLNKYLNNSHGSIDFNKVIYYTFLILDEYPFNIEQIYITGIAYDRIGEKDSSLLWFYKYDTLIKAIFSTGDGKSEETAFIVTKISDEYAILNALDLNFTGQALISKKNKYYDLIHVAPNNFKIDKLYFDINLFFTNWD